MLATRLVRGAKEVSLTEYAAEMDYYKDGQIRQAWRALDANAKRCWARDNPVQHLKAQPASARTQHAAECFGLDVPTCTAAAATSLSAPVAKLAEDIRAFLAQCEHQVEPSSEPARPGVKRENQVEPSSEPARAGVKKVWCASASDIAKALAAGAPYAQIRAGALELWPSAARNDLCLQGQGPRHDDIMCWLL